MNNYGFDIEKSEVSGQSSFDNSQSSFVKIGFVKGSGNSNSPKSYSFVDTSIVTGSVEYRLKQIDNDGSFKYSNVVTVNLVPAKYTLYQNYPNPFNPTTTIKYDLPKQSKVELKIYNMLGEEVVTLVNKEQQAGRYSVQFDVSSKQLASGVYIYRLQAGNYSSVKKLVLLK
ncbi:MAG: T9SS type A sorting domain-containing protein [Bacteroidetes bacterium]|nr:T9SS type A sorting domain-containing protein [Bacteroidota bacterium]